MSKDKRISSIELLRIFSMFLIVLGHTVWETNWQFSTMSPLKATSIQMFWIGGKYGVNIFFLITGYFISTRKEFKIKPLITLWVDVLAISWLIGIFSLLFKMPGQNIKTLLATFFPISMNCYWFITVYFFLYLISPFLNVLIRNISKINYFYLLFIGFLYLFVFATFFSNATAGSGNTLITGIYLYLLGAAIRKYHLQEYMRDKKKILLIGIIVLLFIMILSIYFMDVLSSSRLHFGKFIDGDSPFQLIFSSCIFLLFLNLKLKSNKYINKLAKTTLFIYMLHTNYLLKDFIFDYIFRLQRFQNTPWIIMHIILAACIIYIVTTILYSIYNHLFSRIRKKLIDYITCKIIFYVNTLKIKL